MGSCLFEKFRRSPRKTGRRKLATEWFERDFKDGNLGRRRRVVICKQLFPASSQPVRRARKRKFSRLKLTHADYAFASYVSFSRLI